MINIETMPIYAHIYYKEKFYMYFFYLNKCEKLSKKSLIQKDF